jgi:type III secretion system YscQ/HrcQ family protein
MSATFPIDQLASFRREELPLWNWYAAAFPGAGEWRTWLVEVAAQMLRLRGTTTVRVIKTNLVEPGQAAERIRFDGPVLTIGRSPENSVVLAESTITRQHARLSRDGDAILLEDLGSAMGTLRAGAKLTPGVGVELRAGDAFVIFPHRFAVEIEREWIAGRGVEVETRPAETMSWGEFADAAPANWSMLAVNVEPAGEQAAIAADPELLRRLAGSVLAEVEAEPQVWQPSSEAVIELLLLAALERANRDLAFPFQFSLGRFRRGPRIASGARGIALAAVLDLAGIRGALRVFLPFELLRRMEERWQPRRSETLEAQATWRFPFRVGYVDLTTEERRSIEVGDILLYSGAPALLCPGEDRKGFEAEWDGAAQVRLRESFDRRMCMAEAGGPLSFDDLPVRVQVLMDEHELTLAQASRLAPGAVLDLDRDPRDPVRLAVNGRLVGTGELTEVEGRLGVRIVSWSRE